MYGCVPKLSQTSFTNGKNFNHNRTNLAALNITDDKANSRQGSRTKLHPYNNTRRDRRRPKVPDNRRTFSHQKRNTERRHNDHPYAAKCHKCADSWPHLNAPCPARGKQCKNCNRHGHFVKVCRSTQQQSCSFPRKRPESESDDYVYSVPSEQSNPIETPKIHRMTTPQAIQINNVNFPFIIDTGASINVMDENAFSKLKTNKCNPVKP